MVAPSFVPLRVRSHGSLLWGVASPAALIARALELGYDALALTDRDNLYLAIPFLRAARPEGLTPLPGAEVTRGPAIARELPRARRIVPAADGGALLLPFDRRGWSSLCGVLTARHLDPRFDLVRAIGEAWAGLHVVVETPALAAALLRAGVPAARGVESPPRRGGDAGRGGVWLGVRGLACERAGLAERLALAHRLGVPVVATGDVAFLHPRDREIHRVAITAAAGELLERMPDEAFATAEASLVGPAEWVRRIRALCAGAGVPEAAEPALANNAALVSRCRLEIEMGTPIFPRAPLPPAVAPSHALGAEIVGFARARGIPSVGRGSGASSMVAYCLGITNVDPLRYELCFERFLHPARRDCPDLDIDLCWQRRDEVIAHVYETYGHDRVATIATHATLGARSAFRETAKALGVPNARVDKLAARIPRTMDPPYLPQLERLAESRGVPWHEPPLADALALAERLAGAPRHLSVHCGGIVIGDRALTEYVPLQRAAKDVVVTQFEMRAIEQIGLVKMDLLGNRALTTIGECLALVRRRGVEIDADDLLGDDPATARRVASGDTLNCFQLESPAMRHLVRMLHADDLADTIAAVALVRPGPAESGMKEVFCRRQRGLEPVTFAHPRLERVLRSTHGLLLYEEDVMRVAAALTGLSLAEGDDLRRAIGAARGDEEFRALERGFVAHAVHAGVDEETARTVWGDLTRFAAYAFCKAHAAGYGTLGWQSARLKDAFPAEWAVGILNHHAGMYATWVHVEDLRRQGVVFRAPCVQRSRVETTLEDGAVRVGLGRVFGLAETTSARLLAARETRPFRDLADVLDRVRPSLPETESLIHAGALDWTGRTRPSLLLEARVAGEPSRRSVAAIRAAELVASSGEPLAPDPVSPVPVPELPEFEVAERVRGEIRATGLWFGDHPLACWIAPDALRGTVPAAAVPEHVGRRVAVAGLPCASRPVETKQGGRMLFLTLADRSGLAECALFPDAYRRFAAATRGQIVRAEGRVDETLGAVTITAERVASLA